MTSQCTERLVGELAVMDRQNLIGVLSGLNCGFKFDFTKEFLDSVSIEHLRHIVFAACLRSHAQ